MAYKKYIRKGGKTFGPYYYESYRDSSGKVRKKYVGLTDPDEDKKKISVPISKKRNPFFVISSLLIFTVLILSFGFIVSERDFSFENLNLNIGDISGDVISPSYSSEISEKIVEKENVKLDIKIPGKRADNKNKRMDFSFGDTDLRLYFDVLNYSSVVGAVGEKVILEETDLQGSLTGFVTGFVSLDKEGKNISLVEVKEKIEELDLDEVEKIADSSIVEVENFDIELIEDERIVEDYKWGYRFNLKELDFIAKIDITSNEEISVWNSNTLRVGNSLLSFEDLEREGYSVRIEKPALEMESSKTLNEIVEEEIFNESITLENESNESIGEVDNSENESFELIENSSLNISENNSLELLNNASNEIFKSGDNSSNEEIIENSSFVEEEIEEENDLGNSSLDEEELIEDSSEEIIVDEDSLEEDLGDYVTGNVISGLTGFVVGSLNKDLEYENKLTIYIERDFRNSNYSIGDEVFLDPTLVIIPITDAVHLDSSKNEISNIYDETKELDGVWSGVVGNGEYVRATFETALDNSKDITIYARSVDNLSADLEIYEENSEVLIAKFINITFEEEKKIYLTNLSNDSNYTQSTFDLKVVGESSGIEFDWIVDPTFIPSPGAIVTNALAETGGTNLVRLDDGTLVAVWNDASNLIACSYSSDNGATWKAGNSSSAGVYSSASIATNGTRVLIVAERSSTTSLVSVVTDNYCPSSGWSWNSPSLATSTNGLPSLEYDGISDSYVMCYKHGTGTGYANMSSGFTNTWSSKSIGLHTSDSCGISVEDDGDIHVCVDSGSDLRYYNSSNVGSSFTSKVLQSGTAFDECDISSKEDNVAITFADSNDNIWVYYSDNNGLTFSNDSDVGGATNWLLPSICLDKYGTAQLLYTDTAGSDPIVYSNYTVSQGIYSPVIALNDGAIHRRVSMICSNFPTNNKVTNGLLEYIYGDNTNNSIGYSTQVFYTPKPEVIASATAPSTVYTNSTFSVNITAVDYDDATFTGNARFYVNDVLIGQYVSTVNNGTSSLVAELLSGNFSRGDNITAEVWANDSDYTSPPENLTGVIVSNIYPTFDNPLTTYIQNTSSTFSYDFNASDLDGDSSFIWYGNSSLFDINSVTGEISYTPVEAESGTYDIWINVSDGTINSTEYFILVVNDTTAPVITVNSTSPETVYTNTSFEVNLTVTDGNASSNIVGYVQFYVNNIAIGSVQSASLTNSTSGLVGTLLDGNFSRGDSIIAEVWASDSVNLASKVNLTAVVVSNIYPTFDEALTTVNWNTSYNWTYDFNASDLDGDTIIFYDNTTLFDINSSTGIIFHETNDSIAGTYSIEINISDGTTNSSNIFTYVLADTTGPILEILGPTTGTNPLTEQFNYTATDASGTGACWYSLNEGVTNSSIDVTCSNFTEISVLDGNHTWTLYANDTFGNNNSASVFFTHDSTPPVVVNGSGMVANNSVGGTTTFFNWSVTDNIDINLTCYPQSDGVEQISGLTYVSNNSQANVTIELDGGLHLINVTCYDDVNNSAQFEALSYLVAIIDFLEPTPDSNSILRYGDTTNFTVNETEGSIFINNITLDISNSTSSLLNLHTTGDPVHSVNYTWAIEPAHLTTTATGFNNTAGTGLNVMTNRTFILLRSSGNTTEPNLNYTCPTVGQYVLNNTEITLELVSDLDTLAYLENVTIVDPDGVGYKLANTSSNLDVYPVYSTYHNYTFNVNKTGEYLVLANITDYENQSDTWNYTFISGTGNSTYRINSTTITNFIFVNKCSGKEGVHGSDSDLTFNVINGSLIDLNVSIEDTLHNITLGFRDVNISSNLTGAVNYVKLTNETDPPSGKRRVALLEFNSSLNFTNYTFTYDYSEIAYTLNNESSLGIYFCLDSTSCTLTELNYSVDVTQDLVIATGLTQLSNASSYFLIGEDGTTTETVTVTETVNSGGGGGGGSVQTVYRDLNILSPGNFELGLKDQIVVPVTLNNPEDITLRNIKLNATSSTTDIDPIFESTFIEELLPGENKTVMLFLESHSIPGDYEVYLQAEVGTPNFIETETIHVRLVETVGEKETRERIVLAEDLFRENPQCLELNDLLIEAQKLLDLNRTNESRIIVQEAIYRCKQLVTNNEEFPLNFSDVGEWKIPIIVVLTLVVVSLIIVVLTRKTKLDLKTSRESKRKFFGIKLRNPFRRRQKRKKSRFS